MPPPRRSTRTPVPRDAAARLVLGASGLAAAVCALLPALLAGLIVLFDLSARALLGTSGSLLGIAGEWLPGAGSLPPAARIAIDPGLVAAASLARGLAPVCMVVLAIRPHRAAALLAAVTAAIVGDGWIGAVAAAPGILAALSLRRGALRHTLLGAAPPDPHQ